MRAHCRTLTGQARRICSNQILPATDHRFSSKDWNSSHFTISKIMESRGRCQAPDAGLRAPEQAAHLHTQHVQRHCGEVGGDWWWWWWWWSRLSDTVVRKGDDDDDDDGNNDDDCRQRRVQHHAGGGRLLSLRPSRHPAQLVQCLQVTTLINIKHIYTYLHISTYIYTYLHKSSHIYSPLHPVTQHPAQTLIRPRPRPCPIPTAHPAPLWWLKSGWCEPSHT